MNKAASEYTRDELHIETFHWKDMGVEPIYKKQSVPMHPPYRHNKALTTNIENYAHWVMATLKRITGQSPGKGQQWNACAIFMNSHNVDKMHRCFLPMDWLNLSPCTNNHLADNEFGVLVEEGMVDVSRH